MTEPTPMGAGCLGTVEEKKQGQVAGPPRQDVQVGNQEGIALTRGGECGEIEENWAQRVRLQEALKAMPQRPL